MADDDWISAAEALEQASATMGDYEARRAICSRAHAGLITAKATRYLDGRRRADDVTIPKEFWWARGEAALMQNWVAGDFETWIDHKIHLKAYGVAFAREGINALAAPSLRSSAPSGPAPNPGGRPSAAWWDDLWVEICRQLWTGELIPQRQSDIETAMMDWTAKRGFNPGESTIRPRARKLWTALQKEDEN